MKFYPTWIHVLAWTYLVVCFLSALAILLDYLRGHRQRMGIMHVVWPVTAMYWGPVAVWMYFRTLPRMLRQQSGTQRPGERSNEQRGGNGQPTWMQTATAVFHCGAGCTLGDIAGEWVVFLLAWTWAGAAFQTELVTNFLFAFALGIVFQYFTIAPMRGEKGLKGIWLAVRADTASIVAFELGLFGWMALSYFVLFPAPHTHPDNSIHWFMMQVGMIIGFFTSYPANLWLLSRGWKEKMPQGRPEQQAPQRAA